MKTKSKPKTLDPVRQRIEAVLTHRHAVQSPNNWEYVQPQRPAKPKESREDRFMGKRLAHINGLLDAHISKAQRPLDVPILVIITAFGLTTRRDESGNERQHNAAWDNFDVKPGGRMLDEESSFWEPRDARAQTYTRENVLWRHVTPILRGRLKFRINHDLLPAWKQREMQRLAKLTGFDYAAQWKIICEKTLPAPKAWGAGIDRYTLAPVTLAAKWRLKKASLKS